MLWGTSLQLIQIAPLESQRVSATVLQYYLITWCKHKVYTMLNGSKP